MQRFLEGRILIGKFEKYNKEKSSKKVHNNTKKNRGKN
jgi:hypothetical protein